MRFLVLSLAALVPAASAAAQSGSQPAGNLRIVNLLPTAEDSNCPPISRYHVAKRDRKLRPQKLHEQPVADAYLAVSRRIGRCEAPIIVRYGIGGDPR